MDVNSDMRWAQPEFRRGPETVSGSVFIKVFRIGLKVKKNIYRPIEKRKNKICDFVNNPDNGMYNNDNNVVLVMI